MVGRAGGAALQLYDGLVIQLRSEETGRYLRVLPNGQVDAFGGHGPWAHFIVRAAGYDEWRLEAVGHRGHFLRIAPGGVVDGNGGHGPFTVFRIISFGNGREVRLESTAIREGMHGVSLGVHMGGQPGAFVHHRHSRNVRFIIEAPHNEQGVMIVTERQAVSAQVVTQVYPAPVPQPGYPAPPPTSYPPPQPYPSYPAPSAGYPPPQPPYPSYPAQPPSYPPPQPYPGAYPIGNQPPYGTYPPPTAPGYGRPPGYM